MGDYYQPRGGSLVPPYDGTLVYWDAPGSGFEEAHLMGVECLGDNRDFQIGYGNVYKNSGNTQYGHAVVDTSGLQYEGCFLTGPRVTICDFKVDGHSRKLTATLGSNYARSVLKNWASYQASYLVACGSDIVGEWTEQKDLTDLATDCIDYGPFDPHSTP